MLPSLKVGLKAENPETAMCDALRCKEKNPVEMKCQDGPALLLLSLQVKFQHEVYPPCRPECDSSLLEHPVSRQVFIVQDLEIRDRLATSQMNKFLYLYCSKEMPRKAHSNMVKLCVLLREF